MSITETKAKTVKDRQEQIQTEMMRLLNLPSAYSVWDAQKMDFKISRSTRLLTVGEIELNHMAGKYPKSDMHILKAVHALGFATKAHIMALLRYWKKCDEEEALGSGRERLNIPELTDKELWGRIMELCRYGVLIRREFWPPEEIRKPSDTARSVFHVSASGASMYKTILSDNTLSFDQRLAYMNEEDVFRYVLTGMAAASFLGSAYVYSARFHVSAQVGRRKYQVLAEIKASLNKKAWEGEYRCRLIFEGVTFRTNPAVVTRENRYKNVLARVRELWTVVSAYKEESPVYVLFCTEDGYGLKDLLNIIAEVDSRMFSCCLFTTGTVLEYHRVFSQPEGISESYLEYLPEKNGRLAVAVGYYFLDCGKILADRAATQK